jgi:hypothetical protein
VDGDKMYIENIPGGRFGQAGYFSYHTDKKNLAEIWKRYDPGAAIEIAIIQQILKDQQKTIDELREEISKLKNSR